MATALTPSTGGEKYRSRLASGAELEEFHRELFLPLVWRATFRHGLTGEDAKDVVQEAFLLAFRKLRINGNPKVWLTQVVDRLSANHQRKLFRRARLAAKWGVREMATGELSEDGSDESFDWIDT